MVPHELVKANPNLKIRTLEDDALSRYARLLDFSPLEPLADLCDRITCIYEGNNTYVASLPELEIEPFLSLFGERFGAMSVEIGYCNGPNSFLNGLEWHKSPEIDIAVTDLVLLLGLRNDMDKDGHYDSGALDCFYLPKGSAIELVPETLHYSPCRAHRAGFKSVIVLPKGTNTPLSSDPSYAPKENNRDGKSGWSDIEPRLLFMRNKWLIAHPERKALVEKGAFPGIRGENIRIVPVD
jgi:hypothetical protein